MKLKNHVTRSISENKLIVFENFRSIPNDPLILSKPFSLPPFLTDISRTLEAGWLQSMFQVESQAYRGLEKALRRKRCRDKTVLAAAADQSRGSTIKVGVAVSGEQSSPGVEGTFRVGCGLHRSRCWRLMPSPYSGNPREIIVSTRNSYESNRFK